VTGGSNKRVSLAALIATRPGHPARMIYRTRTSRGKDQRKGFTESWLRVYRLPPYASELNPVEPVWSNLKRSLANLAKQDIGQLTALIKTRLRRMQYRPVLLDGFLAKTGLDLSNFQN